MPSASAAAGKSASTVKHAPSRPPINSPDPIKPNEPAIAQRLPLGRMGAKNLTRGSAVRRWLHRMTRSWPAFTIFDDTAKYFALRSCCTTAQEGVGRRPTCGESATHSKNPW